MTPRIVLLQEKKLIGKSLEMSLVNNKTYDLWSGFSPQIKSITNTISTNKFSLQIFEDSYFKNFNPNNSFIKWAAVEVTDFKEISINLNTFLLKEGLYAVFDYKGDGKDGSVFTYIYTDWLPNSEYQLDARPHFELLGDKYKNNDPDSEEEIWIPIQ